jgi:hypothetical protein
MLRKLPIAISGGFVYMVVMDIDENIIGDNEVITSKSSMEISKEKQKWKGEKDAWSEGADNLEGKLNTLTKEAVDQIEDCKSCAIQTSLQSEDHKAGVIYVIR